MSARLQMLLSSTALWAVGLAIAAALALSWALRGAPIGQAAEAETDEDAPPAGYRDRVVGAAVAGLLLIALGAVLAATQGIPWSLPAFALGFGVVLYLNKANRRYRHASPSLRRVVDASHAAVNAALLGGILIVGNVLAFQYGGRPIDLTHDRAFSLASLTARQVRALDRPTTFTLVFGRSESAVEQWERILQLLRLFQAENPGRVRVERVNPFADPQKFDDLRKVAPDLAVVVSQGGGVLIEYGEGAGAPRAVVRNAELFEAEPGAGGSGRFVTSFRGEDALVSALIRLREGTRSRVAFITGHGEPSIHDVDPAKPGLGLLRSRLESLGARVVVNNLVRGEIDPATELAILAGPRTPFQPEELGRLKKYLDGGGHLLLLIGPTGDEAEATGLDGFLKAYDVEVGPGTILDRRYNYRQRPSWILGLNLGDVRHPIVDAVANRPVVLPAATPVKPAAQPANAQVTATAILRSSPESWARTDPALRQPARDPKEPAGPFDVAVAVADRPASPRGTEVPRLVVIGSRQAADNPYAPLNFDLIVNAANWLRGRTEQRGEIPAKQHTALTLAASPQLRAKIVLIPTLMALSVILGFGIATYLARRE